MNRILQEIIDNNKTKSNLTGLSIKKNGIYRTTDKDETTVFVLLDLYASYDSIYRHGNEIKKKYL